MAQPRKMRYLLDSLLSLLLCVFYEVYALEGFAYALRVSLYGGNPCVSLLDS